MTSSANLVLFDLDHTLLPFDSSQEWGHFMARHRLVDDDTFAERLDWFQDEYVAGRLDMNAYLRYLAGALATLPRKELNRWHGEFMREVVEPAIASNVRELVSRHLQAGDLCCIVTATVDFVTRPIAGALGIDHLLAIELETIGDPQEGDYTGAWIGVPTFREGKITRTEQWLAGMDKTLSSFPKSYFYSDSMNDVPLMERVTHPVATNPDPRLRQLATERGWPVLELFA